MKKNGIWSMALYDELLLNKVTSADECKNITAEQFDTIVRKVRVERFSDLKDQKARQNADKLLVKLLSRIFVFCVAINVCVCLQREILEKRDWNQEDID